MGFHVEAYSLYPTNTIAAVAVAPGQGIAVIRLSGPDAEAIGRRWSIVQAGRTGAAIGSCTDT